MVYPANASFTLDFSQHIPDTSVKKGRETIYFTTLQEMEFT
jgi:hypothetical protein